MLDTCVGLRGLEHSMIAARRNRVLTAKEGATVQAGRITALTVGGFRVFEGSTTFPVGQLTLLFGPNSAGKSAIGEAIDTLAKLCLLLLGEDDQSGGRSDRPAHLIARQWRRSDTRNVDFAPQLQLGCEVVLPPMDWARAAMADPESDRLEASEPTYEEVVEVLAPYLRRHREIRLSLILTYEKPTFISTATGKEDYWGDPSLSISLQGEPIVEYVAAYGLARVHLRHKAFGRRLPINDFKAIAARYSPDDCEYKNGWLVVRDGVLITESGLIADNLFETAKPLDGSPWNDSLEATSQLFGALFNAIRASTLRAAASTLGILRVSASRTVPDRSELTYLMNSYGVVLPSSPLGVLMTGNSEYAGLTASAFRSEMERTTRGDIAASTADLDTTASDEKVSVVAQAIINAVDHGFVDDGTLPLVNRLLQTYVFRERGYRLASDAYEIRHLDQGILHTHESPLATAGEPFRYLVSLVLRDSVGRTFNFQEVGSGIGYVLPVLVCLASARRAYIQQPELHLHPALQADLADAFVARMNESPDEEAVVTPRNLQQCIVETHSEHFLLRLLRRIRQGDSRDMAEDVHTLGREQLVVLYVDPRPDGTSVVKQLRVTRDGEFLDRWPRGFFDERWKELFDE